MEIIPVYLGGPKVIVRVLMRGGRRVVFREADMITETDDVIMQLQASELGGGTS